MSFMIGSALCHPPYNSRHGIYLKNAPDVCVLCYADCAPGLAYDSSNRTCQPCPEGQYCAGGDAKLNPNNTASDCPDGLQTSFAGAKSVMQCFTKPGYGRVTVRQSNGNIALAGAVCDIGRYNVGSNAAGCQSCGPGLTTNTTGSTSMEFCSEC